MTTQTADAVPAPRPVAVGGHSVLGADLHIVGDVTSLGSMEISGELDGTVTAKSLIVGQDGRVKGKISAETVEVRGFASGKISCANLTLRATSTVKADVNYSTLAIESGATVDGKFARPKK